jgi:NAD(P)-dependent dehydrogenase (short-subunit alcohol dehydrogenase family)
MTHANRTYCILAANSAVAQSLAATLEADGARVHRLSRKDGLDLTNFAAVEEAVGALGHLDGLVNCAGSVLLKPAHLTTQGDYDAVIAANLTTAFAAVRAGAKAMMHSGGSVVLVSSAAARAGLANHEAIAAAKAGVSGLALSAAASYAKRNIRVNCVAPGLVESPITARITSNEASLKASIGMHALGRIGAPGDIASAIAWFLHPAQSWVTGQTIAVDGGLSTIHSR